MKEDNTNQVAEQLISLINHQSGERAFVPPSCPKIIKKGEGQNE